jgi:hypothetical protein
MYGTETARSNGYGAGIDKKRSIRQQGFALLGLVLPLFAWSPGVIGDDSNARIQSLEQTLKESGKGLPRFHMRDGRSIVGRFVRLNAETITIRRPAGGLRSVPIAEISNVEIVGDEGKRIRGWLIALADGTMGWTAQDPARTTNGPVAAATTEKPLVRTGGPLIKLPSDKTEGVSGRGAVQADAEESVDDNVVETEPVRDAASEEKQLAALAPSTDADHGIGLDEKIHLDVHAEPASETENVMFFRLSLSTPPKRSVLIIYSFINGSAMADSDFKHRQGVLVFAPGEQHKALAVEIIDDEVVEDVETFQLFVTADPNTVTVDSRTTEARIQDNDS